MSEPVLPDRLTSGMKLKSPSGYTYTVSCTSKKDTFGEPMYRLLDDKGLRSRKLWSRDELQESGAELIE